MEEKEVDQKLKAIVRQPERFPVKGRDIAPSPRSLGLQLIVVALGCFFMATRTVGPGGLLGIPTWVVVCLGLPFLLGGIFVQLPKSGPPATPIKKILGLLMFISASAPIWWFMLCSSLPLFIRLFFAVPYILMVPLAIWSYLLWRREKAAIAKQALPTGESAISERHKW